MSHKAKSLLYFASFVIAAVSYYTIENADAVQSTQLAENIIESVSIQEALN